MSRGRSSLPDVRDHFDRQSSRWGRHYRDTGSMQSRVSLFTEALTRRLAPGGRVLDLGCGTGEITSALGKKGMEVVGCDISLPMIETAKSRFTGERISFVCLDVQKVPALPFDSISFDAVVASSVFEYLPEPKAQLQEIIRILRPGGYFLFTVPDMRHPLRRREGRRISLLATFPFGLLARMSPWKDTAEYLRLSVNRFGLEQWLDMLGSFAMEAEQPGPCTGPLALLIARKPAGCEGLSFGTGVV